MIITLPLNLAKAADLSHDKKDARYWLNGIFIEPGKVTATNGHILFHAKSDDIKAGEPVIVQFQASIQAMKGETLTIDTDAGIAKDGSGKIVACEVIDGKFPDYERVMPKSAKGADVMPMLSAVYLETLGKVTKAVCMGEKFAGVYMEPATNPENSAMRFTWHNFPEALFLIMPMKKPDSA